MFRILPLYLQHEKSDCAHACIAMVAAYWGHEVDVQAIRSLARYSAKGMTLFEMREICARLHLNAQALRVELQSLRDLPCPAILHWDLDHFVVLKKVRRRKIWIHDPAIGVQILTLDEASRSFTGVVLLPEPTEIFEVMRLRGRLRLWDFVRPIQGRKRTMALLLSLSLCAETVFLIQPMFMQYVTDAVVGANDWGNLYALTAGLLLLLMGVGALDYLKGRVLILISNQLQSQWSMNSMWHVLRLPLSYFERRHKGNIQLSFQSIDEVQRKMSVDLLHVLLDVVLFLLNGLVMLAYSPFLTTCVVVSLITVFLLRYISYDKLHSHRQLALTQRGQAMSIFIESLQGMLAIRSFSKEQSRLALWRHTYIHALNAELHISKMQLFYQTMQQMITQTSSLMLICLGAGLILRHQLTLGMLVAFLSYRLIFVNKAMSLIQSLFDYRLLRVQLDRVRDVLLSEPEELPKGMVRPRRIQGALEVNALSFAYEPRGVCVFENLSFQVAVGEKFAIIGPSGCGKTTLLKVMMGLFEPTAGRVLCDGISIDALGLLEYRKMVGSVMQEDQLLSGSIRDNIAFFEETIDWDWMQAVAKIAAIHETISTLPMGYETRLGEMGSLLSGGQKQRLLLARALYKRPKILFLDEASSHLDVRSEQEINTALKELSITQIIVAHRKETIHMADRVFNFGVP